MLSFYNSRPMFYREGNDDKGGDNNNNNKDDQNNEKDDKKEFDVSTISPEAKAYMDKQIADAVTKAATDTATKVKADTLAEVEKSKKDADRKAAKEKAQADGDAAEIKRLADEQTEADRVETKRLKDEAQADRDMAAKEKIATKYKLPGGFESRLQGTDKEEWEADAKKLAEQLPKYRTANTEGGDHTQKETPEDQKSSAKNVTRSLVSMF